jgi:large subunit ribosomal protein L18e
MKRTGPTNIRTRALVVHIEKHGKKTKEGAYAVLSELINVPSRQRAEVNLSHLNELATTYKDKVFVVPGTVLAKGTLTHPIHVAALRFSGSAANKIKEAKGKAMVLEELVTEKVSAKKIMLVK